MEFQLVKHLRHLLHPNLLDHVNLQDFLEEDLLKAYYLLRLLVQDEKIHFLRLNLQSHQLVDQDNVDLNHLHRHRQQKLLKKIQMEFQQSLCHHQLQAPLVHQQHRLQLL
jgi:hypothetical protein